MFRFIHCSLDEAGATCACAEGVYKKAYPAYQDPGFSAYTIIL